MNRTALVTYAVSLTGGNGVHAITARRIVPPGSVGVDEPISLSMFAGDHTNKAEVAEHAKKVLTIATGYDVAILDVEVLR
jgi:hypothetical protein